jgi:hypothetical protein
MSLDQIDPIMEQIEPKVGKTADKKTYMREYKRNQYNDPVKGAIIKERNKAYYIKRTFNPDDIDTEMKEYGTIYPVLFKLRKNLKELKSKRPDLLIKITTQFIEEMEKIEI